MFIPRKSVPITLVLMLLLAIPTSTGFGAQTIEQAIDANDNGYIDDAEILQAIQYWINGTAVPGTGGQVIDDSKMLELIEMWINRTPISPPPPPPINGFDCIDPVPPADGKLLLVPDTYPTINQALAVAQPGDKIFVKRGSYVENLVIRKSLILEGRCPQEIAIKGNGDSPIITVLNTTDVTIRGFSLTGGKGAISVSDSTHVLIKENDIWANFREGISVSSSGGIELRSTVDITGNIIRDNLLVGKGFGRGISVENSEVLVKNNKISDNYDTGIGLSNTLAEIIENQIYSTKPTPDRKFGRGISLSNGSIVHVVNNEIVDNTEYGMLVSTSSEAEIKGNQISGTKATPQPEGKLGRGIGVDA